MKKRSAFLSIILALAVLLVGCGAGAARGDSAAPAGDAAEGPKQEVNGSFYTITDSAQTESDQSGTVYRDPNAKLIRKARLRVQTTEFDQAAAQLEQLVAAAGGYFENISLQGGGYLDANANRSGEYTVRIPGEQYDAFLRQTGNLGYVTYRNESTENIGEQYYDTQSRLKTQKTKQERLLALLAKADNMEDIISLENALGDVEYEIERLTSTLNRYDNLVGFATIDLTLDEVHKVSQEAGVADSLVQRMSRGVASSLDGLVEGFQSLLVWVSYNAFGLLFGGVILCVFGRGAYRKFKQRKAAAPAEETRGE